MLQAEPVGDGADARAVEALLGKLRDRGVEDRLPRVDCALLLGALAWALSRCLRHLAFD